MALEHPPLDLSQVMKRFFDIFHLTWINDEVYRTAVGQIHRNLVCVPIVHQKHLYYQNVVAQIQNIELCKAESVSCVIDLIKSKRSLIR